MTNLHQEVTKNHLRSLFQEFGRINVILPRKNDGAHTGTAIIKVESQILAEKALELRNQSLFERKIEI